MNQNKEQQHYISHALGWRQDDSDFKDKGTIYIQGSGTGEDEVIYYLWNIDKVRIKDLRMKINLWRLD